MRIDDARQAAASMPRCAVLLLRTGLAGWTPALTEFVGRYAGLEKWSTREADAPACEIAAVLASFLLRREAISDAEFLTHLLQLRCLHWHARWPASCGAPGRWDPLRESLEAFEGRCGPGNWPDVWESDRFAIDRDRLRAYLLGRRCNRP